LAKGPLTTEEAIMQLEQVIHEKADGIATITLNRPERMNAFTPQMLDEWYQALLDAHLDPQVRAIIITGSGRGFCTGMDVTATATGQPLWDPQVSLAENRNFLRDSVHPIPRLVARLDKPYIVAVNGPAVGAGMDMASMADIRFASQGARFGMAYVRIGLIPGDGGCYYLPRIVGVAKALELIWTGDLFDAQEALRIGYVSAVLPPEELMSHTREFALRLARGPAVAIQLAKRLVYRGLQTTVDEALEAAQQGLLIAQSTEDAQEGPRAFVEKRPPQFKGR
jgi:2-(1,2-epoxy-1,2-dihydrophenyl)acetyl-CoA isomerase